MNDIKKIRDVWSKFQLILSASQKRWGMVIFLMSLLGAVAETLGVSAMLPLVQAMLEPNKLLEIDVVYDMYVWLGFTSSNQLLILIVVGVIGIYVIKNLYMCLLSYARVKYSSKVQRELSVRMLRSYMERGYSFFRVNNTATLLRGVNTAVAGIYHILYQVMRILAEVLTIICIFAFVVYTDWVMAIMMILLVGICLLVIIYGFKGVISRAGKRAYEYENLTGKWALQLFSGIKEVLVLNRKNYFIDKYEDAYIGMHDARIKQTVANETPAYIIEGTCIVGIIIAVCIRVIGMEEPAAYIPRLAVFAVAAFRVLPSMGKISSYFNNCIFYLPAVEEVYENIKEAERFERLGEHRKANLEKNDVDLRFEREIRINDIVWKYSDGTENVLDHVSLSIKKGESVAFVGPSGAGKSTLADIVLGLFQPQQGNVLIDGVDICNNRGSLSKIMSFVPQSVYLLDDTIRRNVAFGVHDNEIDETSIWQALEQAQMKEFVKALPDGLNTVVGERGVRFSGGQSQRLAIARALYTNPDILVLDEATSALDSETEAAVMEAIDILQGQKTLIIIAHRISTIKNCNKIYKISGGQAVEKKYEELFQDKK